VEGKAPRYDIPNAAPAPLSLVQSFVNTINRESGDDWLCGWLEEQSVEPVARELRRARVVREAIRDLLDANNSRPAGGDQPPLALGEAADAAKLSIDFSRGTLVARAGGIDGVIGRVLAVTFTAMADGSWRRLKACRNGGCRWAFYDYSKNASATWCSMQLCGNRHKTRAYRARRSR
jgi:predicted RNA-binding Zn ribbon-like protein